LKEEAAGKNTTSLYLETKKPFAEGYLSHLEQVRQSMKMTAKTALHKTCSRKLWPLFVSLREREKKRCPFKKMGYRLI
jgi:hypothetical protein